ncbi:MAG: dihydroneopterin aldolase [Sutterellaceae bacterium]|nr:dihydroneopterin aldolase [Sutterellaceae bacterium]MDD7442417.1 dihydroneopterin aldolase [Sutterellaceae bacterium]MDY2868878.1 dihydroneopterin aldolase [Mesosutterella sp.]
MADIAHDASLRRIFIENLRLLSRIGIYPREITANQEILISISVWVEKRPAEEDIGKTVNYAELAAIARRNASIGHIFLVETLVENIVRDIRALPGVKAGRVNCRKLHAVPGAEAAGVEEFFENDQHSPDPDHSGKRRS